MLTGIKYSFTVSAPEAEPGHADSLGLGPSCDALGPGCDALGINTANLTTIHQAVESEVRATGERCRLRD